MLQVVDGELVEAYSDRVAGVEAAVRTLRRGSVTAAEPSVVHSLGNLLTFPWIAERVKAGRLTLHGAYFGVATGQLLVRNPATGSFEPVSGGQLRGRPV